jgi:multiple sugar transport system permease protein
MCIRDSYWNSFIEPLLYIRTTDRMVASQGLRMLYQVEASNWPIIMAGSVLMIVPVVVLFFIAQRAFAQDSGGRGLLGR